MAPRPPLSNNESGDEEPAESTTTSKAERKKKKKKETKNELDPHEEYVVAARAITRCIDLWCDVDRVIKMVLSIEQARASEDGLLKEDDLVRKAREERLSKIPKDMKERCLRTYSKLLQMVPAIKTVANDPTKSLELSAITDKMNACIRHTRSNDATRLKASIGLYAAPNPRKEGLTPPIVNTSGRSEMGLNHPTLARFLCPIDHLSDFDADTEGTCASLKAAKIRMSAEELPALLWSGVWPGDDYDSDNELYGLFRSYYLVRVGRHIFLGPSAALGEDTRATRSCNAILHDMTSVEAAHIAYICVQARFAISSKSSWSEKDGEFNYVDFYRHVESLISDPIDTVWRDDLLKWWNNELFGNEKGRGHNNVANAKETSEDRVGSPARMTTMERLRAKARTRGTTSTSASSSSTHRDWQGHSDLASSTLPVQSTTTRAPTPGPSSIVHNHRDSVSSSGQLSGLRSHQEIPATPPRQSDRAMNGLTSTPLRLSLTPLTSDGPLTPLTNKKGKEREVVNTVKGKKRMINEQTAAAQAVTSNQGGTRKSKRSRR